MNTLFGAGIIGIFLAAWGHIKATLTALTGILIVRVEVSGQMSTAVEAYLWRHGTAYPLGPIRFQAIQLYVHKLSRSELVPMEMAGERRLCMFGWRPIMYSGSRMVPGEGSSSYQDRLSFIRWTFNVDDMIRAAMREYNTDIIHRKTSRHEVVQACGTVGSRMVLQQGPGPSHSPPQSVGVPSYFGNRFLEHDASGVSESASSRRESFCDIALDDDAESAAKEIDFWFNSRDWHMERGIPWRRGYLLHGEPGNGKTSFVRAMGVKYDMPVMAFQLATMRDEELIRSWNAMLTCTPVIALFEDLDAVFNGRVTISGEVTFDCLLNVIDGVSRSDGVLVFITTNNISKIDRALGQVEMGSATRPGRIDRVIEMRGPDRDGRMKIARRILADRPDVWDETVDDGEGDTGAQFESRCITKAREILWRIDAPVEV